MIPRPRARLDLLEMIWFVPFCLDYYDRGPWPAMLTKTCADSVIKIEEFELTLLYQ